MVTIIFIIFSTAGINSLLIPVSPIGVTTSFSLSKGDEAIFYNPANFEAGDDFKLACFYNQLYVSMKSISLALSKKINGLDFGLGIMNFDYGDIEWRPTYPTEDTLLNYSANDFLIALSGGVKISPQGRLGINYKYIAENIYIYHDYAFAFDISLSYRNTQGGISFGATNFGYKLTLNNEEVNLPARLSLGGYRNIKNIAASFDLHYLVNNGKFEFGLGLGLPVGKIVEFNAGMNYRENFYPGFGLVINTAKLVVKYGTAIYPYNLGMINTLGIGLSF